MSARDVIESELSKPAIDASGWTYFDMADAILAALLAAPEAVRLELARELVKAEGWRVVQVPDAPKPVLPSQAGMALAVKMFRDQVLASENADG